MRKARSLIREITLPLALLAASVGLASCSGQPAGTEGAAGNGAGSAGTTGAAGTSGAAGTNGAGGRGGTTGTAGTTGAAGTNGAAGRGGTTGTAGTTGAGGRGGTTGTAGTTGAAGRGGTTGTAGTVGAGGAPVTCSGAPASNQNPFGCTFGWGRQNPSGSGSLASYNYLQHVAFWIEPGVRSDGTFSSCSGCSWLTSRVAPSTLIPVYYAYLIGFYGHANGLPDQNTAPNSANLSTGGAALIKANRAKIIQLYTNYAQQTNAVWGSKPLVWLLEGDFIQYTATTQSSPLTYDELGQLAADITCAIKGAMPNAVVAIDHSSWNSNDQTTGFWTAMKQASYDLVWTTGVGNNGGYIETAGKAGYYNATTATYAYLHQFTGKNIFVDTSYGASAMTDSWSNLTAAALNMQIANGVIGVNVSNDPPTNYQALTSALEAQLTTTCH